MEAQCAEAGVLYLDAPISGGPIRAADGALSVLASGTAETFAALKPALDGMVLSTNDIKQHGGMAKEVLDHREKTGEVSLWTNSMFGGMPTYQIANPHPNTLWGLKGVYNAMAKGLAKPINMLFFVERN